jgi:membrane associated rhomboid family serine protease
MFLPLYDGQARSHIGWPWVTWTIIAINVLVWGITTLAETPADDLARATSISYGFIPSVIHDIRELPLEYFVIPEQASYVTYSFLHADFMHLAGNMLFLWVFADNVEDALGHFKFIVFYLACAAAAAWLHGAVFPESDSPLIGASGAAAGAVSAYLVLHPRVRVWVLVLARFPLRLSAMWLLSAWILYQVGMFLFTSDQQVSWAAHVGGIVTGAVLVVVLRRKGVPLFDQGLVTQPVAETASAGAQVAPQRWGRRE